MNVKARIIELSERMDHIAHAAAGFKLKATDSDIRYHNAQREVEARELAKELRTIAIQFIQDGLPNIIPTPMKKGLFNKYRVSKVNGMPVDPAAEYFVLRLDNHEGSQTDKAHVNACRHAAMAYANEIEPWLPELSRDLRQKYFPSTSLVGAPVAPDKIPDRHR